MSAFSRGTYAVAHKRLNSLCHNTYFHPHPLWPFTSYLALNSFPTQPDCEHLLPSNGSPELPGDCSWRQNFLVFAYIRIHFMNASRSLTTINVILMERRTHYLSCWISFIWLSIFVSAQFSKELPIRKKYTHSGKKFPLFIPTYHLVIKTD